MGMTIALLAIGLMTTSAAATAATLTDITVFSSNSEGNNWNTQGSDTDTPNRYDLYLSSDPVSDTSPTFLNG